LANAVFPVMMDCDGTNATNIDSPGYNHGKEALCNSACVAVPSAACDVKAVRS